LSLDIATGGERLAGLDDEKVLGVNVVVLGKVVILLCNENTFTEEVLVDLLAVCFWDEPAKCKYVNITSSLICLTSWRFLYGIW
jgi:hypothetical protein